MTSPSAPPAMVTREDPPEPTNASIVVTDEAPTVRHLTIGGAQLLLSLLFGAITVLAIWALITKRAPDPDGPSSLVMLAICAPLFLVFLAFATRNLQRMRLGASVTADQNGIRLRIPGVPFVLAPYQVLREELVPWTQVTLTFTAAKGSRLLVSSARPETAIPPGHFRASLYEIDSGLRSAVESLGQAGARVEPLHVFTGTSPTVLLIAGVACVIAFGLLVVGVPALMKLLWFGPILGFGLIAMGLAPRKRVVIDRRGLFIERGRHLDFIPQEMLATARIEHSKSLFGAFQSGHVHATVDGSKVSVGVNRVIGLGFPVYDIMAALSSR